MKRLLLYIALIALCCTGVQAQQQRIVSREALDSLMAPRLVEGAGGLLRFDTLQCDMGVIYESGSVFVASYPFTNISNDTLCISRVSTNCGCTSAVLSDTVYAPGESGVIKIIFNPRGRSGTVDTNAFVYTTQWAAAPVAKLTLLGNVIDENEWRHLPCSMGVLRLKRKELSFEPLQAGTSPQMRIPCANTGERPLRLSSCLMPAFATFSTEPEEIAPGEEGDIIITIHGEKLPAVVPAAFRVVVDGVEGRLSDRIINVTIEK